MKPIFGIKIMKARKWDRNRDYTDQVMHEYVRLTSSLNRVIQERDRAIQEQVQADQYAEHLRAEVDDQQEHIRKLSKLVTHLENEVEKAKAPDQQETT